MELTIDSRRKKPSTLAATHPGALILDVTSKGEDPWVRFSPFFPHGDLPVPFSGDLCAQSVEGVWQGLKVFENADIDQHKFDIRSMRGIKRTVRKHGRVMGHRRGVKGEKLLTYLDARFAIYLPTYRYLLENKAAGQVEELRRLATEQPVVLLDYETNADPHDLSRPLSHAALVVKHLHGEWPEKDRLDSN